VAVNEQFHRTALSKHPGFTGNGKVVDILYYYEHRLMIIFQNSTVSSPEPKIKFK